MNIVKLQNELKNVPDQALIGYVQNPTGQVPSYLALSELQRRKEMREKYQAAQPEKTTVAQDLEQQAQPQPQGIAAIQQPAATPVAEPGVAGLPTGDMYQEQNFAGGGIVAFADGGRISPHVSVNPLVDPDREGQFDAAQYVGGADVGTNRFNVGADMAGMVDKRGFTDPRLQALYANYVTDEGNKYGARYNPDARQASVERISKEGNRLGFDFAPDRVGVSGEYRFADGGKVEGYADGGSIWDKLRLGFASPEEIVALQDKVSPNPFLGGMPETNSSYVPYNVAAPAPQPYPSDNKPVPGPKVAPKVEAKPAVQTKVPASTGSAYDLEKVKGIGAYADELQNYIGVDPMRAKLQARMDKMDAAAAKQAEQAPWMALAQAGFGMAAGKSPFALQNIAEGATSGLKSYADAQDKLATLEEKRFNLVADMAKSDRAEKVAVAKYGADSKQAVEERNFKRKLQEQHDNVLMKMNDADNSAALSKAMLANRLDQKDLLKYKNDYRSNHPEYLAWQKKAIDDKGKNVVNTKEFKDASDALLNQLITRDLNQTKGTASSSMIDTSQWSLAS